MSLQARRNAGKRDSDGDRFVASLLVTVAAIRGLLGARTRGTSQTPYPKHAWQKSCCSMLRFIWQHACAALHCLNPLAKLGNRVETNS